MTTRTPIRTRTITARVGFCMALGLLVLASGAQLANAAQPKRLGVVTFRGPGEGATRNVVTKAAKAKHFQVVGGQQISKAASKLKVSLDSNDGFLAVARELGISAFVTGEVSKKKGTLTVRNGADGSVTAEASWRGPNPRKLAAAVNKTFWRRLGGAIERGKGPSGAKQAVVAQEETAPETGADEGDGAKDKGKSGGGKKVVAAEDAEGADHGKKGSTSDEAGSENVVSARPEREDEGGGSRMEALNVGVGPRFVNRSLAFNQNVAGGTRNYKLAIAPVLALNVDVFPAAFSQGGFISNIGLTGSLSYMLPVVTTPVAGVGTYKTYALDWSVGVKVRFPIGVYGTVAYGDQRYQLVRPANTMADVVPMVDYRYVRIGGGARIPLNSRFLVMANVAYLQVLSFGQIANSDYFPHTTGRGIEAGAAVAYRLTPLLELQGGADIRRYGLAFNVPFAEFTANPSIRVAGGAVDQYVAGWVAVAMSWGGDNHAVTSSGSHTEEEETPAAKSDEDKGEDKGKDKNKDKDEEESDAKPSKKKAAEDEL
jgi:hypothetical protein